MVANYNRPWGPDVSSYQPNTDWGAVKAAGATFAFVKCSESTDYINPRFARDWAEIRRVGLYRGAYHFARPSVNPDPTPEVYFFLDTVQKHGGGLPKGDCLVLDMEDVNFNGDASGWTLFFMQILKNIVGFNPILYTGQWYLDSRLQVRTQEYKEYPLWNASYNNNWPATPAPWSSTTLWQYTDGTLPSPIVTPGIGACDRNYFNGDAIRFPLLGAPKDIDLSVTEPLTPVIVPPSVEFDKEAFKDNMTLRLEATRKDIINEVNNQMDILKQSLTDELE